MHVWYSGRTANSKSALRRFDSYSVRHSMKPENYDDQVKEIMSGMDWKRIHKVMTFLKWNWWYTHPNAPSIDELKTSSLSLLADAWLTGQALKKNCFVGGGGLMARYEHWDGRPVLSLAFEL